MGRLLDLARLSLWANADIRICLAREFAGKTLTGGNLLGAMIVKFNTEPPKIFYVWQS